MASKKNELFLLQIILANFIVAIAILYALAYTQNPVHTESPLQRILQYLFLPPLFGWLFKVITISKLREKNQVSAATLFVPYLVLGALCEASAVLAFVIAMTSGITTLIELVMLCSILVIVINFPRQSLLSRRLSK